MNDKIDFIIDYGDRQYITNLPMNERSRKRFPKSHFGFIQISYKSKNFDRCIVFFVQIQKELYNLATNNPCGTRNKNGFSIHEGKIIIIFYYLVILSFNC